MINEKSAGGVIINDKNVLLLHYTAGHWDFPKGHMEGNETEIETAKREIKEETNITELKQIPNFRETINYIFKDKKKGIISKEVVYFIFKTKEKEVKISKEHTDHQWILLTEAGAKITFNNSKEVLAKAIKFLEKIERDKDKT